MSSREDGSLLHPPVNQVMTSHPGELLHMDTVGPARVRSVGGKWYILVIVDDFSRYSWVFFLETKDEAFQYFRDLALRLQNELPHAMRAIAVTMALNLRMLVLMTSVVASVLITSTPLLMFLHRMAWLNAKIGP